MAGSSEDSDDDSKQFEKVFTEGPLEELTRQCDVITCAILVGSSKSILESTKDSATLAASPPFGLPCVLHSHPTLRPWEYNELEMGTPCKLTPLDRFSSEAVMPDGTDEQWAGANGDWIATVGLESNGYLVNMYTRRKIHLQPITEFESTDSALTFEDKGFPLKLQKIVICQVPTAAGGYEDFSLIAIFDDKIAFYSGSTPISYGWIILDNQFLGQYRYCDAIQHERLVFAVTERGNVDAWHPLKFGPLLLRSRPGYHYWPDNFEEQEDYAGMWLLARSPCGSRLLLVYTPGVANDNDVADDNVHYGRTVRTYAFGFGCLVFSMDTSGLFYPGLPWEAITDLVGYSLFLGVNYPMPVGGEDVTLGDLTRSNCVYTSHHVAGFEFRPRPEICRFGLNFKDAAVGFSTNTVSAWSETPLWFIPSFANPLDWNKPV